MTRSEIQKVQKVFLLYDKKSIDSFDTIYKQQHSEYKIILDDIACFTYTQYAFSLYSTRRHDGWKILNRQILKALPACEPINLTSLVDSFFARTALNV